ncbi:MAG: F0F1 ATP synthase subunit epsilon [Ectothiorhodospiraceae bacterium]
MPRPERIRLRVLLPTEVLVDEDVQKVVAEGEAGHFCLLPRHVDYVSTLTAGILAFVDAEGRERFAAVNGGVLVKCAGAVDVSTMDGTLDDDLERLQRTVDERYHVLDERERVARSTLARLEAGVLRRFMQLEEHRHG